MTTQTKKETHIEVITNQVIGIILGWMIVFFLFPLFDNLVQAWVATISSILFFISSYIRSYFVRRFFNK